MDRAAAALSRKNGQPEPFRKMLDRVLPAWKDALLPGGVLALSFNTLTLPTRDVLSALEHAGWKPVAGENTAHLRHEVEQAVVRDVVFALK